MARSEPPAAAEDASSPSPRFNEDECDLLVRALKKHRRTIPVYLQSSQDELLMIDELIRRLCPEPATEPSDESPSET